MIYYKIVYLTKTLKPRQCSHMEKDLPHIPCVHLDTYMYARPKYNLLKYDWPWCGFHLVIFGHFLVTCKLCKLFCILDRRFSFICKMVQYRSYIVGIFKVLCLTGEWDGRSFAAPLTPTQYRFMVYKVVLQQMDNDLTLLEGTEVWIPLRPINSCIERYFFQRYLLPISSLIRLHPCDLVAYSALAHVSVQFLIGHVRGVVWLLGTMPCSDRPQWLT